MCNSAPQLLYYTYIPVLVVTLILGFLVFLSDRKNLSSRLFFLLSISTSLWIFFTMMTWQSVNLGSVEIFDKLSIIGIIVPAIFLYFSYVFPDGKNIPTKKAILIFLPLLPFIFLAWTSLNIESIDSSTSDCESVVGPLYYLIPVVFILYCLWSGAVLVKKFKSGNNQVKKQIKLVLVGFVLFIVWATITNVIAQLVGPDNLSFFGPIGGMIFMSFVAYAIIKYQLLSIKVLLTQALVIVLIIIAGSELLFAENTTNQILILITLAAIIGFGYMLVKSVKKEVEQKEALEVANKEISERKDQLQKISDSLAIANDKLRQLDQAKSDFINIASHQLKKAPTPIKGYASLLLEGSYGELAPEQAETIKKIETANDRQINLVEDLLNVARIESGRMEFNFEKVNPAVLCQEVYDNLATMAKDKGLDFQYKKPAKALPEISMDKGKMFEAVFNFAENAIKYTPSGSVTLSVEQIIDKIRITVTDTGIGIYKDDLPSLFEKFTRGRDTSRLQTEGSGLGLYVVRLMIEAHHGKVWAESEGEGKGSKFIIEIPAGQPKEILKQQG